MRVYWYYSKNFGDALNPYLIEKISGIKPKHCPFIYTTLGVIKNYAAIGSIFSLIGHKTTVWGSGVMSPKAIVRRPQEILAVRGPLSREILLKKGINCPKIYGDPSLLLPKYYDPKSPKEYELGIIPHYMDFNKAKKQIKDNKIIKVINIKTPIEQVIEDIFSCKKTLSSSLHGLIISHAYNIPSIWVEFSNKVIGKGFKFRDYLSSVNLDLYEPIDFRKETPNYDELMKLFENKNFKIDIDLKPLENSCPFTS
ncbi:polysaccharide pyruvyl transferase family protein [Nitrosococcus wardiae]|uniref:Polysaccharide pyruvyl transferase family protein n=1 Tax=Nitrosococcus wardiae TaxID=1814290 RepID=A0A4P7BY83_9GAMM|nr:polysaccharide pyruvyl transferase family protein [Nitrosococcus wardiae]QBQ55138.1 polysaccharide pyruvyl transferase family protein [Nitrosococcus wardiae]